MEEIEKGRQEIQNSTVPIDLEHKKVMQQAIADSNVAELLFQFCVERMAGKIRLAAPQQLIDGTNCRIVQLAGSDSLIDPLAERF